MTLVYPIIKESGEVHTPQSDYLIIAELLISAFLPASSCQLTYNRGGVIIITSKPESNKQKQFAYFPELPEATHSLTVLTPIKQRRLCF